MIRKHTPEALAVMIMVMLQSAAAAPVNPLAGVEWKLVKVQGVAVDDGGTLKFEDDRVTGT